MFILNFRVKDQWIVNRYETFPGLLKALGKYQKEYHREYFVVFIDQE